MYTAIIAIATTLIGGGIGYFLRKQSAQAKANSVEALAEKRLIEAKSQEQQIILEAKEKALKVLDEVKIEERERRNDVDKCVSVLNNEKTCSTKKSLNSRQEKKSSNQRSIRLKK